MEREAREKLSKGDECAVDIFLHAFFRKRSVRCDAERDRPGASALADRAAGARGEDRGT